MTSSYTHNLCFVLLCCGKLPSDFAYTLQDYSTGIVAIMDMNMVKYIMRFNHITMPKRHAYFMGCIVCIFTQINSACSVWIKNDDVLYPRYGHRFITELMQMVYCACGMISIDGGINGLSPILCRNACTIALVKFIINTPHAFVKTAAVLCMMASANGKISALLPFCKGNTPVTG